MAGNWGLIDLDTPQSAYTRKSFHDGSDLQLVFSDEFNTEGRSFYRGDDPYWEAEDLHYWAVSTLCIRFRVKVFIAHCHRQTIWSGTTRLR